MQIRDLYIGNFNPLHIGHVKVIEQMNDPIICVVYKDGSPDLHNEPLSIQQRLRIISRQLVAMDLHNALVHSTNNGFINNIITHLYDSGIKINNVFAGEDRFYQYANNFEKYDIPYTPNLIKVERFTSSTHIRQCVRIGNKFAFKSLTPKAVHPFYDDIQAAVLKYSLDREFIKNLDYLNCETFKFGEDYRDLDTSYKRIYNKALRYCKGTKGLDRVKKIYKFYKECVKCCNIEIEFGKMLLNNSSDNTLAINMMKRFAWIVACYQTNQFNKLGEQK